ncbi:MAG: hypothetical protein NC328_02355 [Muribaculum sp.]|nr:hypothetical protein [Muribaculum sp.]MCM1235140.1 hypothetical protein [Ruminococcus flavefaciens]
MNFLHIISIVCLCAGGIINILAARRNHRKFLQLCEQAQILDEATEQLIEDYRRHTRRTGQTLKQPELFITASSDSDTEITLKLSLDDIDIDKVQDRATREFLLKRRLMTSYCVN